MQPRRAAIHASMYRQRGVSTPQTNWPPAELVVSQRAPRQQRRHRHHEVVQLGLEHHRRGHARRRADLVRVLFCASTGRKGGVGRGLVTSLRGNPCPPDPRPSILCPFFLEEKREKSAENLRQLLGGAGVHFALPFARHLHMCMLTVTQVSSILPGQCGIVPPSCPTIYLDQSPSP